MSCPEKDGWCYGAKWPGSRTSMVALGCVLRPEEHVRGAFDRMVPEPLGYDLSNKEWPKGKLGDAETALKPW